MLKSFIFINIRIVMSWYFVAMLFVLFAFKGIAQVSPKISTTSMGSASTINNQVQQSIGQSSVIGTYQSNQLVVSQGFIQPAFVTGKIISNENKEIRVTAYPNPVSTIMTLEFQDQVNETVNIELCDILGNKVYQSKVQAAQKMEIKLDHLSNGMYFVKLSAGSKITTIKIIKQ